MFETDEFKCPTFIPNSIWKDANIFSGHLPNNIRKPLRDHFDILCFKLQFSVPYLNHFQNKLKLWLAYILSHPTLEIEHINHLSDKLKFNVHEKNVAASILGRWDLFDTTQNIEHSANSELIEFFRIAYTHHHTDFILELFAQYPLLKPVLIHDKHHEVLIHACHNGDIALIKLLLQQSGQHQLEMITSRNYLAFLEACRFGHTEIIQLLFGHAQEHVIPMIQAENYDGFFMACEQGFTDVLKLIAHHAPHEMPEILAMSQYKALRLVVEKQHLETFDFIIEQGQSCLIDMLSAKQYKPFQIACSKNNKELICALINLSEHVHCTKQMLSSQNFLIFNILCAKGNLELIKRYVSMFPKEIIELIQSENYAAFRIAAANNQKQVIEYLLSLDSVDATEMLCSKEFNSIIEFVQFGNADFLGFLAEQYPCETHHMLLAHEFKLAKKAAQDGNFLLLKQVFQLLPPELYPNIVASERYSLFKYASSSNNIECLTFIIEKTPQLLHQMLTSDDYAAFRIADLYNQEKSIDFLLEFPQVFFYAEQHFQEYNLSVMPFLNRKIDDIRKKLDSQTEIHLNQQEAKIYFYIFRHFIRCYNPLPTELGQFMLQVMQNVPRLRGLLADEVTPHAGENELLRFALSLRHNQAIEILLQHEIIRERAIEHHFYQLEIEDGIHLHVLATDQESSMKVLTPQESIRLNSALERYQPLLDQKTPKVILKQFIKQLEDKYQQNPAIYCLDSESQVKLPLQMTDFNQLNLSKHHQELALKQYFQHPIHTCWRFFQTPNLWMHPEAAYTLYNPLNDTERWANYIDYIPLIATLYLAVTDEDFSACDGFTAESRLQHFINEIALLARAHNWDKTRIKIDEHGKPVLDHEGQVIHEAFDDNEGDRPSCYPGMKRRLLQSVLGHSLFKILTIQILEMEIRDFIFQHFQASINADNIDSLSKAWQEWVEELNPESITCLKSLDINMEQQQSFINDMNQRYDKQFIDDPIFKQVIQDAFQLKYSHDAHLFKCSNVEQLLNPSKYKRTLPIEGFFSATEENTSHSVTPSKRSCL